MCDVDLVLFLSEAVIFHSKDTFAPFPFLISRVQRNKGGESLTTPGVESRSLGNLSLIGEQL